MVARTKFGKDMKKRLIDLEQTDTWMFSRVREVSGMYLDSGYLHKIMTGQRAPKKIIAAICEVLEMTYPEENDLKQVC